jgi:hypothetical protein
VAKRVVTLLLEQKATLEVDAPTGATLDDLTALALRALDESGGAEWVTTWGGTEVD